MWRPMDKARLQEIVPEGEGPLSQAITMRFPKKLLEFVDRLAKETQNTRTETVLAMVRWVKRSIEVTEDKDKKGRTG